MQIPHSINVCNLTDHYRKRNILKLKPFLFGMHAHLSRKNSAVVLKPLR